jgi:hypothetical protein
MTIALPTLHVPQVTNDWNANADPFQWDWAQAVTLPPLLLADGSGPAQQQTVTSVCYNRQALFVRFDCADTDIWGTYTQRDDPIYDEEVVEIFIAPGDTVPVDYYAPMAFCWKCWLITPPGIAPRCTLIFPGIVPVSSGRRSAMRTTTSGG